jgi:hypothetical protein
LSDFTCRLFTASAARRKSQCGKPPSKPGRHRPPGLQPYLLELGAPRVRRRRMGVNNSPPNTLPNPSTTHAAIRLKPTSKSANIVITALIPLQGINRGKARLSAGEQQPHVWNILAAGSLLGFNIQHPNSAAHQE